MLRNHTAGLLACLAICSAAVHAQTPPASSARVPAYRARILGVFDNDTGQPIDSARVMDVTNGNSSLTTRTGTVALFFLPDRGGLVRVQKIGYEVQTLMIAISPTDTTPLTLTMRRLTQLAPVVTNANAAARYLSPALRGFEERRKAGFGYFVTDSVLRANEGRLLANVIASRMPSMNTRAGPASSMFLTQSSRCTNGGPPQVYLDGVPLSPDLPPRFTNRTGSVDNLPFNLSSFDVSTLTGVEWYPDNTSAPMEFSHTSARCGMLLLWTRER